MNKRCSTICFSLPFFFPLNFPRFHLAEAMEKNTSLQSLSSPEDFLPAYVVVHNM